MFRLFAALSAFVFLIPATPALADEEVVYPIVFPVDGTNRYSNTWGAARSGGRSHEGTDIMADKMTPVVAAADGTVGWVSSQCCAMELVHDDGYKSRYIHLNNDTSGTDDGQGWGFAPGIESGVHVDAGQLIGYVGDSGNAEWTGSHLHFELRYPDGTAFNSYYSLLEATPPDATRVIWHVSAIANGGMTVDDESVATHVREEGGVVSSGDFDGDGSDEIAVGGGYDEGWSVTEMDGTSLGKWSESDASGARSVFSGDFDGDGDDDIAAFFPTREWVGYRGDGSGFRVESWGSFGGTGWSYQLSGDFDGDDRAEILSFHPGTRNWWMTELSGNSFRSEIFAHYGTPTGWQTHLAADVDGDGADELISFHPFNGTWWATNRGGTPRLVYDVSTNSGWQHLTAGDVDGDSTDELVMYHPSNGTWWVVNPSGSSARVNLWGQFNTRTGWVTPFTADVDSDGAADIVIRHEASGRVWSLLGNTDGRLAFLGTLGAGETEGIWEVDHPDTGLGIVGLTRD